MWSSLTPFHLSCTRSIQGVSAMTQDGRVCCDHTNRESKRRTNLFPHVLDFIQYDRLWNKTLIGRWDTRTWHRSVLLPHLRLTTPTEEFPWDDLRTILHGDQQMAKVQNDEEILPKVSTLWAGRTNVTGDRQTTDRRIVANKDPNV